MTNDIMCASSSKFVDDPTKIVFTDADGIPWFEVHTFSEDVLIITRNNAYQIFHIVNNGDFKDEIKSLTKYVRSRGSVVKLFDEGGTGFTPVMTVLGLLAFTMRVPNSELAKHVRDMAAKSLVNYIIGDDNHIKNAQAHKGLSLPIQKLLRQATDQQRASGGASIAQPPEQVLVAHVVCF
jgi:hypothetical protein